MRNREQAGDDVQIEACRGLIRGAVSCGLHYTYESSVLGMCRAGGEPEDGFPSPRGDDAMGTV